MKSPFVSKISRAWPYPQTTERSPTQKMLKRKISKLRNDTTSIFFIGVAINTT